MKAKRRESGDDAHKFLLRQKIKGIPQIIKEIKIVEGTSWRFTEWIEGKCFKDAIHKLDGYKEINPDLYYKLGQKVGEFTNYIFKESPIGMADLIWNNFIIDENDEIWVIDTLKISNDPLPERWVIDCIIYNKFVSMEQKKAFIDGYIGSVKSREICREYVELANSFIGAVYAKLERK
jgi:tRNA A-37 threonylcarbamoyl transferase component Bud32